jgi:hypothetical protein
MPSRTRAGKTARAVRGISCSAGPALHTELVSKLVAVIRETEGVSQAVRVERLQSALDAAGLGASLDEMLTVAERAARSHASEDELGLALGVVIALSLPRAERVP